MLPDFVVIGAPRTGTTSLYRALCQHPDISPSFRKEIHYFDGRTDRGLDWYRSSFPLRIGPTSPKLAGEATPNYFAHPGAAEAMAKALPDVKLIALLRDPIERAHSAWRLKVHEGVERRSFSAAIHEETNPTLGAPSPNSPVTRLRNGFAYLQKSQYAQHIERWLTAYPADQLLVLRSEDLFTDPVHNLARILEFIGADPDPRPSLPHSHAAPQGEIDDQDREWLRAHFAPYNRKLADIIGLTFE